MPDPMLDSGFTPQNWRNFSDLAGQEAAFCWIKPARVFEVQPGGGAGVSALGFVVAAG
jgi:hypothetical protein